MITGKVEGGFDRSYRAMFRLETMMNYVGPLLEAWANVLVEDNRRGVMQGIDGEDRPIVPTKYRHSITQKGAGQAGDRFFNASGEAFSNMETTSAFFFANLSGQMGTGSRPGTSGNRSSKEYRKATGPPLAPFGPGSRVISNYTVEPVVENGGNTVGVEGGWDEVVSKTGVEFLPFHFKGATSSKAMFATSIGGDNFHLPRRNLVGLRRWGKTQAKKELLSWVEWLLTQAQPEYFGRKKAQHAPDYVRAGRTR